MSGIAKTRICVGLLAAGVLVGPGRFAAARDDEGKVIAPLPEIRPRPPQTNWPANNDIDRFVAAQWKRFRVRPAPLCDDYTFVRRVYLDLAGVIPTVLQVQRFLADGPRRRARLIDRLLASNRYADHWTTFWGDLLRERTRVRGARPFAFRDFIRDSLSRNVPYNQWVYDMLSATGSAEENPSTTFTLRQRSNPNELTIATTQVFLGVQLKCAQCHDHPFEAWTQRDFRGMRRFFRGLEERPVEAGASDEKGSGGPRGGGLSVVQNENAADGRFLTGDKPKGTAGRASLARWVTGPTNPYFARVAVNRLWAKLFGVGLVEPPDEFGPGNPPAHPALLDWLAIEFIQSDYDLKHMIRLMCNSRTYQLSSRGGRTPNDLGPEDRPFHRMRLRRMTAEQLHDSIVVACGLLDDNWKAARPAIEMRYPAPPGSFRATFGSPDRREIRRRDATATIPQALAMLNGSFVNRAVMMRRNNPVRRWLSGGLPREDVTDRLFLSTLSRPPTSKERRFVVKFAQSAETWSDVQWALINTREFMFIH